MASHLASGIRCWMERPAFASLINTDSLLIEVGARKFTDCVRSGIRQEERKRPNETERDGLLLAESRLYSAAFY